MMNLETQIEAVLFYKTEPMTKKALGDFFDADAETIEAALHTLNERLTGGVTLIVSDTDAQLVTAPYVSEVIERLRKEELKRDIGKAGAETLAIILYRGPVTRSEIDLIRGVNSTFILRNLLMRGLIERTPHQTDKRQFQYHVTTNLLAHLGINRKEDLPEYQTIADELDVYEKEHARENEASSVPTEESNT